MSGEGSLAAEVLRVARAMGERGLNQGTSGNVSARDADGMLITPSAIPYGEMTAADVVSMVLDGTVRRGGKPSTEWRMHAGILADRPDVHAVLHAHAPFCTALACVGREIPAFHYMVAVAGGASIRCAPYAPFGTAELAALALEALDGRRACLLANHGMLALGESPAAALDLAVEVEFLAAAYWRALQVGEPVVLSGEQMADVMERFRDYRRGRNEARSR